MDNSERRHQAMSRLHAGLPRQGPGSEQNTRHALSLLPQISANAIVYDLGCGPGRASLVLAEVLKRKIVAVDLDKSFLAQLERDAVACEMDQLIETRCADMAVLNEAPASVGLIWSEGAIYCVGFDIALRAWRPFLVDDGVAACSELSWLVAHPSAEPSAFWHENYPGMRSVEENVAAAVRQGYHCFAHYTLPTNCWW
jgi:serine/threonine-protein kinase HipA